MNFQLYEPVSPVHFESQAELNFCFLKLKEFWLIQIWARFHLNLLSM